MEGNQYERCLDEETLLAEMHRYIQERGSAGVQEERQAHVQPEKSSQLPVVTVSSESTLPPGGRSPTSSGVQLVDEGEKIKA